MPTIRDKKAYLFVIVFALLNLTILLTSSEFSKCNMEQTMLTCISIVFSFFLHYIVIAFALFGFLFNDPYILALYLILPVVIWSQWKLRDKNGFSSSCALTNFTDLSCNVDIHSDSVRFIDIFERVGVQYVHIGGLRNVPLAYLIIVPLGYYIAIRKLMRMRRRR